MAAAEESERITVKFIKDEPSEIDFFGSHSRVAAAVSNIISEDNGINVVGLLGSWGSGKSTVVTQIQKMLEDPTTNIHFFNFDAWLYQNDPPRRSFLEALIQDLSHNALSDDTQWNKRLADLSGRSEETETETSRRLSLTGKWIFGTLGLVPIGTVILGRALDPKNLAESSWMLWLGILLTLAPLITASGFYLAWRQWKEKWFRGYFTIDFLRHHRASYADQSIFALLTNQSVERTEKKTKISPEPSVTEFRSVFRDILKSLRVKRERLIIVIDNLDRLAEAEAVELWATIRSLFLGNELRGSSRSEIASPTIILPIDEGSIRRMFSAFGHKEDAINLAQSFMDKTFDVAFHVNDPVMSDWRAFFREKLLEAFSSSATEERIYWATKFVEEYCSQHASNQRITPRLLIKIVNSVGVLFKQWNDESINFLSFVFFALYRSEISKNPREFIKIHRPSLTTAVEDWQRDVVALHYGVKRNKAFQILLEEPLRTAITHKDTAEFSRLAEVIGFGPVFEEVVANLPTGAGTSSPQADFVANAAILVSNSDISSEHWAKSSMPNLASAWCASGQIDNFREDFGQILIALAPHSDKKDFIQSTSSKLAHSVPKSGLSDPDTKSFVASLEIIQNLATDHSIQSPTLELPIEIKPLLHLADSIPERLRSAIRIDKTSKEVLASISNFLSDEKSSSDVPTYIRALSSEITINFKDRVKISWDDIVTACYNNIVNYNASFHSVGPSIDVLGLLQDRNTNAKTNIQQLFDQGYLNTRLCEADQGGDSRTLADIAALMYLRGTDFAGPNGKTWSDVINNDEEFVGHFTMALTWYLRVDPTMSVNRAIKTHPTLKPIIFEMVKRAINDGSNGLSTIHIVRNIKQLENLVGSDSLVLALRQAATRADFWSTVDAMDDGAPYDTVVETLARMEIVDRTALSKSIRERLSNRDASGWKKAISDGTTPFSLVEFYGDALKQTDPLGSSLKSGLQDSVRDLLQASQDMRQRWFYLSRFVTKSARITSLKNLRDLIHSGSSVNDLAGLMDLGGSNFMNEGKFSESPDKTTRHITIPLLTDYTYFEFVRDKIDIFSKCYHESDEETRQTIVEILAALRVSGDEEALSLLSAVENGFAIGPQA